MLAGGFLESLADISEVVLSCWHVAHASLTSLHFAHSYSRAAVNGVIGGKTVLSHLGFQVRDRREVDPEGVSR